MYSISSRIEYSTIHGSTNHKIAYYYVYNSPVVAKLPQLLSESYLHKHDHNKNVNADLTTIEHKINVVLNIILLEMTITEHVVVTTE